MTLDHTLYIVKCSVLVMLGKLGTQTIDLYLSIISIVPISSVWRHVPDFLLSFSCFPHHSSTTSQSLGQEYKICFQLLIQNHKALITLYYCNSESQIDAVVGNFWLFSTYQICVTVSGNHITRHLRFHHHAPLAQKPTNVNLYNPCSLKQVDFTV